jgi:hypothetical protein
MFKNRIQQQSLDKLLRRMMDMIDTVRLGGSLGTYSGVIPGESGWTVSYTKDLEPMTEEQVDTKLGQRTAGVIILRVSAGGDGDIVDVEFTYALCTVAHRTGTTIVSWREFSFWLLSDPANDTQLVLRLWASYGLVIEAWAAIMKVGADPEGNIFVEDPQYTRHIDGPFFEYGRKERSLNTYNWIPDLIVPDDVKKLLETFRVCGQVVIRDKNFNAFKVSWKSSDGLLQRVGLRHSGKMTIDWEGLKQAPINLTWFARLKRKLCEALVFFCNM